ncbi:signal peptidase I [Staphylothermus hellenicus]|uniref:Peptidase S26B, signal peptidase n=1 Tax=Staphylothermus hellenicus (strain DSM 12710 / JCM 10830 / BK20S6-10-b1 / P8) TaxID=591019 RepID=D7D934_STAHD|nr:signal peptidase I [Staphylothermus hellenicus]ADI32280.1 peptidase S26B, signal peptidase [Staphylothermus hellenicus DSM 12710]
MKRSEEKSNKHFSIKNKKVEIIKYVLLILVIILALNTKTILYSVTGSTTPIAVVKGYSMFPILREGDIVFAYRPSPNEIRVGDIIIYKGLNGELIIHRVIKVIINGNKYYYVTKGDNNPFPDYPEFRGPGIPYERVEGVVLEINGSIFKIQYLGYLSIWFHGG